MEDGVGCQEEAYQGADYSGRANTTIGGLTCQAWSVQEPHSHDFSVSEHGQYGIGNHNYCRNPDGSDGVTLQTLTRDGSTALCLNVKGQMEWKILDVRRRTYG